MTSNPAFTGRNIQKANAYLLYSGQEQKSLVTYHTLQSLYVCVWLVNTLTSAASIGSLVICMWSPADICEQWERNLSFSSADVRGAGTRDETLRTSAWETIKKSVCGVSLTRTKRASCVAVSPQSHSPFSASFQTFCLTTRAYLNTQKYGLFCSLLSVLPICSKQALILLIADCFQNGNPQDPNCNGIHGVIAAYYHSIERVQLHGNISDLKGLLGPVYKGEGLPSW